MGWKVTDSVTQRYEFVLRALVEDANMSELCRTYGISRKTGYKWIKRFQEEGRAGLEDRSRRPKCPRTISAATVAAIVAVRTVHAEWGPKKLLDPLSRRDIDRLPSCSTIAKVLKSCNLVKPRKPKRSVPPPNPFEAVTPKEPNDLWTIDFKGWWLTKDLQRFEPLTLRDQKSRFVLLAEHVTSTSTRVVGPLVERAFERYGLPAAMRFDNGAPFASPHSLGRLTRLSARWKALGIRLELTQPGRPDQNGAHERMHRDLKAEVQAKPALNRWRQQAALDSWRNEFNHKRPHEALGGQKPADVYRKSKRSWTGKVPELVYPSDFLTRKVLRGGTIKCRGRELFLTHALTGMRVGLQPVEGGWRILFDDMPLAMLDGEFQGPIMPIGKPAKRDRKRR